MPRLLHLISDLEPGGAATQLRLQIAARGEQEDASVATLRRPGPLRDTLAQAGAPVVWTPRRFRVDPFALAALVGELRRRRPDVVQSWDNASAAFCRAAKRLHRFAWVHTHRGGPLGSLQGVEAVLATDALAAASAGEQTTAPVVVVPNAFDPAIAPTDRANRSAARGRIRSAGWDVSDDAPVLLCVTRIDDAAAVKEIAWASDLIRVVRPGLRLLVAGDGPGRLACERFAAKATERGTVLWIGATSGLATLYAAADIVWVGRGAGAAPTPAIEAMAAGKPLVMAEGPGRDLLLPDWLLPNDTSSAAASAGPCCRLPWDDRAAWARTTKRLFEEPDRAAAVGAAGADRVRNAHRIDAVMAARSAALARVV
ncbi:Glycosyl transferases group 1 [Botrimarina colliarenosi]|uniref:Glycosyl transferases group 1 n=1 Tax=Botrimarina colliarenosi TaxID=2528001 RepID=A0A5C6AB90_9BACT|nr:glycosyltransferase [Botrimarina colliarenosi]TWT96627.1 Glycosyl transferases group 1 [Botrimarina colliarenosi]